MEPTYIVKIEKIAFGGAGVARLDGCVIFVPGVLPGESVRIRIRGSHKTFAQGELLEVLEPAPERTPPECPLMWHPRGRPPQTTLPCCPGCSYGHMPYAHELALKQEQFAETLERIGGFSKPPFRKPLGSPEPLRYRNKIVLHTQKDSNGTRLGYLETDNRTVLDIPACPLAAPPLDELLRSLRAKPGFLYTLREGMDVTLRWTARDGALYWRGTPSEREPWLLEATPVGSLLVPRGSFFQVNPGSAALLVEAVQALLRKAKPRWFVDLYCGSGLFSHAAAAAGIPGGAGLDSDPVVIAAAVRNGERNGLTGFSFRTGTAELDLPALLGEDSPASTLLLADPPRTGLEPAAAAALAAARPRDVIYVSCAADTLARDLARLAASGYELKSIQLVDMFPRTAHFESVAWLRAPAAATKPRPAAKGRKEAA